MGIRKLAHIFPGRVILFSIFLTIVAGALLLSLPIARIIDVSFIDLLFTATSATCVTGLFTIPIGSFTMFGKCVILMLIQIGGLGLITMTLFVMSLFIDLGLATQLVAGKILELETWKNIKQFILFIIVMTLTFELIGILCMFPIFATTLPYPKALFLATFHSVSSFCNAGITLGDFDIQFINAHASILAIIAFLVFSGGFGFITWHEILLYFKSRNQKRRHNFSLHTKIVIYGLIATIITFALVFFVLEYNHALSKQSFIQKIFSSLFHAITLRSAGPATMPLESLHVATIFFIMIMAFIGSAPGSTGSGIKITTLAVFLATIKTAIRGRTSVEIRGRTIATEQVYKAMAIIALSIGWIVFTTMCLLITEHHTFMDIFVEVISGFTNLGLSMGITPYLSLIGKLLIMLSMIIGRIGSLTLILALKLKTNNEPAGFSYPEERVMLS
ncbi:MAG: hypothetical protein NTX86_01960 [Candidatus Dependentiae bacterium]|nr:hypothetical protein [Candidatus Dependentiae bacterium]